MKGHEQIGKSDLVVGRNNTTTMLPPSSSKKEKFESRGRRVPLVTTCGNRESFTGQIKYERAEIEKCASSKTALFWNA
jgi:hypothetical protein